MNAPVEAQSLSGLTNLLANPPQYPRNPTHTVHEPLVLYIVRVPGSQDVFLSPVKPPTKVSISLEALQSSLYYFHVETEDDKALKRSLEDEKITEEPETHSITVTRKPLPAHHPLPPLPDEAPIDQQWNGGYSQRNGYQPYTVDEHGGNREQQPGLRLATDFNSGRFPQASPTAYPYLQSAVGGYAISPSIHENGRRVLNSTERNGTAYSAAGSQLDGYTTNQAVLDSTPRVREPGSKLITMIRRDPATNSQWNIGTISFLQSTFGGSNVKPIAVDLTTPGYCRFNKGAGFDASRPISAGIDADAIKRALQSTTASPSIRTPVESWESFSRVVDFRRITLSELRHTVYQRTNSWDKYTKNDTINPKAALEKNALMFDSPWLGQCTFVNGIDGISLKLKHTIKPNSSSSEGLTANLAELRFNLGWSIFGKKHSRSSKEPEPDKLPIEKLLDSKENFRKSFQHLKDKSRDSFRNRRSRDQDDNVLRDLSNIQTPNTNHLYPPDGHNDYPSVASSTRPTSSENDDDEHRLSLKLGREKAGGGFRGKSAKLGKLIIEDEGLKMCDLVVGAAMGIWWQHYQSNA